MANPRFFVCLIIRTISFFQANLRKRLYFYRICLFFSREFFFRNVSIVILFKKNIFFSKYKNNIAICFSFKKSKLSKKGRFFNKLAQSGLDTGSKFYSMLRLSGCNLILFPFKFSGLTMIVVKNNYYLVKRDIIMLYIFSNVILNVLANALEYKRILCLANTDPLTGIMNRRLVDHLTLRRLKWAKKHSQLLLLILIDIDHFKFYNDQFGHSKGDYILKQFAFCLKSFAEKTDIVARLGGEEFCIVTVQEDQYLMYKKILDLKEKISKINIQGKCSQPFGSLSASFGVCLFWNTSINTVMRIADKALFIAKNNGRNKVVVNF